MHALVGVLTCLLPKRAQVQAPMGVPFAVHVYQSLTHMPCVIERLHMMTCSMRVSVALLIQYLE
jgi:hypothetical protein